MKHGAGQLLQENKPEELNAHFRVHDFHETSIPLETYLHRRLQLLYANVLFYPALMVRDLFSFFESSAAVRDIARGSMAKSLSFESLKRTFVVHFCKNYCMSNIDVASI